LYIVFAKYRTQERSGCRIVHSRLEATMNSRTFQSNAEHCLELASQTNEETKRARLITAAKAWRALARYKSAIDVALLPEDPVTKGRIVA
jgi:hypothetical protein